MIETNFNDLDDDFITLWSRYFLTNNYNEIKSDIIRLAEKGQINAIAMYYGFLDKNEIENEKIKKALDDYEYMDYNFYHAEAFRNEWLYKKGEQNFFKAKVSAESAFWDNAETVLGNSIRNAVEKRFPWIAVKPAKKRPINDRIRCTLRLMGAGRFWMTADSRFLSVMPAR